MNQPSGNQRFLILWALAILICLGGISWWFVRSASVTANLPSEEPSETPNEVARDPGQPANARESDQSAAETVRFQYADYETTPDGYVGTERCASCHRDQHQSYLLTHHSRSLREIDPSEEVSEGTLSHPTSKQSFTVAEQDGLVVHQQWRHFGAGPNNKVKLTELPACYVMGSGAFGRGYLLADDEYLLQSPVTWYAETDDLGMAPGYDQVFHFGLTRMIEAECLFCHAGLMSRRNENPAKIALHELSIGCERCHGPGEEHAELYARIEAGELKTESVIDPKIVHPTKLDRRRTESICGQCHLHGDIVMHPPGKDIWDFVPGEDLVETRLHYKHDQAGELEDSFTGHFDQMWQSQCYLQSDSLTCITCHNPHRSQPIADPVAFHRDQCNRCHAEPDDSCGLPMDERVTSAANNCVQCHMPKIESDVPHSSTTSHLIAVYVNGSPRGVESRRDTPSLRRIQDSPAIDPALLTRADAYAEAAWAVQEAKEGDFTAFDQPEWRDAFMKAVDRFPNDASLHSMAALKFRVLAERAMNTETSTPQATIDQLWEKVQYHATEALRLESRPVESRRMALECIANYYMHRSDYQAAADKWTEMSQIRRASVTWYNLGICLGKLRRFAEAEHAFREAIRIEGTYVAPYRSLSVLYRSFDPNVARQYANMAQMLMSY